MKKKLEYFSITIIPILALVWLIYAHLDSKNKESSRIDATNSPCSINTTGQTGGSNNVDCNNIESPLVDYTIDYINKQTEMGFELSALVKVYTFESTEQPDVLIKSNLDAECSISRKKYGQGISSPYNTLHTSSDIKYNGSFLSEFQVICISKSIVIDGGNIFYPKLN